MSVDLVMSYQWRYATKQFDSSKRIPAEHWKILEQSLILSPSSYGLQPWQFHVVTDQAVKDQLPDAAWGQTQPRDCSHFVVIAARQHVDSGYVQQFIQQTAKARGVSEDALKGLKDAILSKTTNMGDNHLPWTARQCYIALGFLLSSASVLGIDACPMEGIVPDRVNQILGLNTSEYTAVVACALGYRTSTDKYAAAAKVRFDASDVVIRH